MYETTYKMYENYAIDNREFETLENDSQYSKWKNEKHLTYLAAIPLCHDGTIQSSA